jgi:FtsP/CotA-like multicopper oxidase with cupredoxin domain
LLTVASGGALARTLSPSRARAASSAATVALVINEGYVRMTDGLPAWMRGFGFDGDGPMVPGPPIGSIPATRPFQRCESLIHDHVPPEYGEVPFVLEGETVEVTITNTLKDNHTFFIEGVVGPVTIPAGANEPTRITFTAPPAGTYIYMDDDPIQRILGLHGVMVVLPRDEFGRPLRQPYAPEPGRLPPPTFDHQFVWVFHDVDPVWGAIAAEQVRLGQPIVIDLETFLPRYFTINGVSGEQSVHGTRALRNTPRRFLVDPDPEVVPSDGTLIRIVNAGVAVHSPHFHGNHVYIISRNGQPFLFGASGELRVEKDVFPMQSLGRTDVLLPFHEPIDQWPPYDPANSPGFLYPMHCHAEMSQTAGGGQYPSGMYTEWELCGPLGTAPHVGG